MTDDEFKLFLPKYLSPSTEEALFQSLKQFVRGYNNQRWYSQHLNSNAYLLQGDFVDKLPFDFTGTGIKERKGLIISNTCDMSIENESNRLYDSHVLYAPLFTIDQYERLLSKNFNIDRVRSHIDNIKQQKTTNTFFLKDYNLFARLDMIRSIQLKDSLDKMLKNRLNCLSQFSWYLMLFKLSMHLCRMQEGIERDLLTV